VGPAEGVRLHPGRSARAPPRRPPAESPTQVTVPRPPWSRGPLATRHMQDARAFTYRRKRRPRICSRRPVEEPRRLLARRAAVQRVHRRRPPCGHGADGGSGCSSGGESGRDSQRRLADLWLFCLRGAVWVRRMCVTADQARQTRLSRQTRLPRRCVRL
jgi:hypothetical protein